MKVTGKNHPNISETMAQKTRQQGEKISRNRNEAADRMGSSANHTSLTMDKIKAAIRNEPDVRMQRVADLKAKIRSGKYQVDPESVANKMVIASLREDLEKP